MIFDPSSAPHLKPWLVRTLEPICDAEPGALADYILALLKHNVPESDMKKELTSQLEEFLENECGPFVETLFTALRTKSYLPYAPPSPPPQQSGDEGVSIPVDAIMAGPSSERTRKRSASSEGRDGRPKKGPRLGNDADFAGYGGGQAVWGGQHQFGEFSQGMDGFGLSMGGMGMTMPMNGLPQMSGRGAQGYQPPGQKRGICRDYHNHGFCARGEMCKFSHGEGAVVPSQLYPMNADMINLNMLYNMMNQNNPNVPYDPNEPQTNRQNQRAPIISRIQQGDGSLVHSLNTPGELPVIQDLTPTDTSTRQTHQPLQQLNSQPDPAVLAAMAANGFDPSIFQNMAGFTGLPSFPGMQMAMDHSQQNSPQIQTQQPVRPSNGFRGRGRGRGGAGGDVSASRPPRRGDKTLVVEKIPHDKLSHEGIVEWFKKFGDVTNVAVDRSGSKALVSFATHEEAHKAWRAEDAVFGNRFVKVFWHRPMEGHGQIGQRALAASQGIVANLKSDGQATSTTPAAPSQMTPSASTNGAKKLGGQSRATSALAERQELLEKQIGEQKTLMAALAGASAEEKKSIMDRLRALGKEMEETKASVVAVPAPALKKVSPAADAEDRERERLDRELEDHGGSGEGEAGETTEELKAKLEKLKAEAASLGIADGAEQPYGSVFRGGYRGRARGARGGYNYRGGPVLRGGPPRGSMKLDNRPKVLIVKGVPLGEEGVQVVKDWYDSTGQVDSLGGTDDGVVVAFKSRSAAEQALAKGTILPTVGKVSITWHTPGAKPSTTSTNNTSTPVAASPAPQPAKGLESVEVAPSPHRREEEELVASGWGDEDGDDGMGMQ